MRPCFRTWIMAPLVVGVFASVTVHGDEKERLRMVVKLVDEAGKPVDGAFAGITSLHTTAEFPVLPLKDEQGWRYRCGAKSNAEGIVEFETFGDGSKELARSSVVARQTDRNLVAIWKIDPEKLDRGKTTEVPSITLRPACHVTGQIKCSDLTSRNRETWWLEVDLKSAGNVAMEFSSFTPAAFEFFVPPGEYVLRSHNQNCHVIERPIVIREQQTEMSVGTIDLPATQLALLEGMLAPELTNVICWKNSPGVELSRLKGKVVLLDFWGYWCGPCIREMPELFELYDKYHEDGLEVIGIHIDTGEYEETPVDSVDELDKRLRKTRKDIWNGRDVPYPVALVSGRRTSFKTDVATPDRARGELVAKYGVTAYPAVILIDRNGIVVGSFNPGRPEDIERLNRLLKGK